MTIFLIIAAAFSVMLASLAGVMFTYRVLGDWMRKHLTYLATFSAGVLVILAYHLIEEALHEGDATLVAVSIISGIVLLEIIQHLLPDTHHHHEMVDHAHTAVDGRKVLISDAVHNVTDGFLIVPAFLVDWRIGIAATISIFFHEVVQEISEFFVLKEAGYSDKKALVSNFFVSSTILIGVALALTLASFETVIVLLTGFAAGGFLSVVIRDLLPHTIASIRSNGALLTHTVSALLGALLLSGIIMITPHYEEEFDEHLNEGAGQIEMPEGEI